MKKFLLSVLLVAVIGFANKSNAQCNGVSVLITNISVNTTATHYVYSFNWTFLQGNASIQVRFRCGTAATGTYTYDGRCFPFLKDSTAGLHIVKDSIALNLIPACAEPVKALVIGIWTSNACGGNFCEAQGGDITLPVKFASFDAKRTNGSNVAVTWSTAFEQNNAGFAVERLINGTWTEVGYVASQANGGNSESLLSYSYLDLNNVKGISQYRIRQVDVDGKISYSSVKSVRGENQPVKLTVYPNPSSDGKVNIAFDDAVAVRNVSVLDLSGRVVRQINGITNNNITIENLNPGMYTVRVMVPETGAQGVEKIIVNKR